MTTEQLRKEITVNSFHININGIFIEYYYESKNQIFDLCLSPEECARQLSAIGSIDSWEECIDAIGFIIHHEGYVLNWNAFYPKFKLSQWEALTLAIRHEYEKELEEDDNLLAIDKTIDLINKLKKV